MRYLWRCWVLIRQRMYLGFAFLLARGCSRASSCRCTAYSWKLVDGGCAYAWGLASWGSGLPRLVLPPIVTRAPPRPAY